MKLISYNLTQLTDAGSYARLADDINRISTTGEKSSVI
jgi:hypothetical protein